MHNSSYDLILEVDRIGEEGEEKEWVGLKSYF